MSESAPPAAAGGRRILGMKPMTAYLVFGGALAIGIVAYLIKQHQAASAANATTAAAGQGAAAGAATATGIDYSGELSTIQTELEALLAQQGVTTGTGAAQGNGGGWSGGWGQGGSGGDTGSDSGGSSGGVNGGSSSGGSSASGGSSPSTGGSSSSSGTPAAPSGGHVVSVSNNDAVVAWNPNGAAKWNLKITGPGAINGHTATVGIPQGTYSGLEAGHTYDVTVTPVSASGQTGPSGVITIVTK